MNILHHAAGGSVFVSCNWKAIYTPHAIISSLFLALKDAKFEETIQLVAHVNDFAAVLPAAAEDGKVYHSINPTINPHYMACSVQVHPQNMFSFWMAKPITQGDTIVAEEYMPTTCPSGLESDWLTDWIEQGVFSNKQQVNNRGTPFAIYVISSLTACHRRVLTLTAVAT